MLNVPFNFMNNMCVEPFEPFVFEYGFLSKSHNLFNMNFPPNLFHLNKLPTMWIVLETINHNLHAWVIANGPPQKN